MTKASTWACISRTLPSAFTFRSRRSPASTTPSVQFGLKFEVSGEEEGDIVGEETDEIEETTPAPSATCPAPRRKLESPSRAAPGSEPAMVAQAPPQADARQGRQGQGRKARQNRGRKALRRAGPRRRRRRIESGLDRRFPQEDLREDLNFGGHRQSPPRPQGARARHGRGEGAGKPPALRPAQGGSGSGDGAGRRGPRSRPSLRRRYRLLLHRDFEFQAELHRGVVEAGDRLERNVKALGNVLEMQAHVEAFVIDLQIPELILQDDREFLRPLLLKAARHFHAGRAGAEVMVK